MDPMSVGGGVRSEINVTPLVDVCLVLLIIFMVVTPRLGHGSAQLPETEQPARLAEASRRLELILDRDGRVLLDEQAIAESDLELRLREWRGEDAVRSLVVKADRRLPFADVRRALKAACEAGFSGAGLATQRKDATGAQSRGAGRPS